MAAYRDRLMRVLVPLLLGVVVVELWEWLVRWLEVSRFVLPAPSQIATALVKDFPVLLMATVNTLKVTAMAFVLAMVVGIAMAVVFARSRLIETAVFPYAVILQVTPIIAIAPLIIIWVGIDHVDRAELILATIVAFFPILSNTTLGLKSVDHNLHSLFDIYRVRSWRRLRLLQFPAALPPLLVGMKISGGLALIGAVVAEFVAGSGTATGLAWQILESGNRLEIPRLFAGLLMLSVLGLAIFFALSWVEHLALRNWHESARGREA